MKKRIISSIIVFALLFSSVVTVSAEEENSNMIKVTDEIVEEIALNWANSMEPELDLTVGNIVELYDNTNTLLGYSVGYFLNETPYGYAIIDFSGPSFIGEYLIQENVPDMYTQIIEDNNVSVYSRESPKLLVDYPFGYAAVTGNNVVTMGGEEKNINDFLATQPQAKMKSTDYTGSESSGGDIFINEVQSAFHKLYENSYPDFIGANQVDIEVLTGSYACVPVALAIIARLSYLEFDLYRSI